MLQRHVVLGSGLKVDRDWWRFTKLSIVIGLAATAAYAVHVATPLPGGNASASRLPAESHRYSGRGDDTAYHDLRVRTDRDLHDRAAAVLRAAGLSTDDAVRTLFVRIANDRELPYRLFPPGDAAVENARRALERRRVRD